MKPLAAETKRTLSRSFPLILIVFFVFGLLTVLTFFFMRSIVKDYLDKETKDALAYIEAGMTSDFNELNAILDTISVTVEDMLLRGADFEEVSAYIRVVTDHFRSGQNSVPGFISVFGMFDIFDGYGYNGLDESGGPAPEGFVPEERLWFIAAEAAKGGNAVTEPEVDMWSGEIAITFARCLYGGDGEKMATVCIDIRLDWIQGYTESFYNADDNADDNTDDKTYRILLDKELKIIAHPEPEEYLGVPLRDTVRGLADIAVILERGDDISALKISYRDEDAIVYAKWLKNGWAVCVVASIDEYYASIGAIQWFLIILGSVLGLLLCFMLVGINRRRVSVEEHALVLQEQADADELNRVMFGMAPVGVAIFDEEDNIIDCNDALAKMFGTTKEFVLSHFFDLSPEVQPDGTGSREKSFWITRQTLAGEVLKQEWQLRVPGGGTFPAELTTTRIKQGDKYFAVAYVYDLRGIKEAERALAETHEQIKIMLENAPVGLTLFDENFKYIDCNEVVLELFGVTREVYAEFFGSAAHSPEYQPDGSKSREKALDVIKRIMDGANVKIDWTHLTPEGEELPAEITLTRTMRDGKYIGLGYLYDLRGIKEAERALADLHTRLKIMMDATPLICNLWNKDYQVFDCNEEALKLFEIDSKQEYMDTFIQLAPEFQPDGQRTSDKARKLLDEAFLNGKVIFEWMNQKKNGTLIPMEVTLTRVGYGSDYVAVGYGRDLREYKHMLHRIKDMVDAERRTRFMLNKQYSMARVINEAAAILLEPDAEGVSSPIGRSMEMVCGSIGADALYLWRNEMKGGELYYSLVYNRIDQKLNIDYSSYSFSYRDTLPSWPEIFARGDVINGPVAGLPEGERVFLESHLVKSTLSAPLFLNGALWGFATIDDYTGERTFTETDIYGLRSWGFLAVGVLQRETIMQDLQAAAIAAEAATNAKSDFLSSMSHEMRTPMSAIIGMTTLGKKAAGIEQKDRALAKIEDASSHLLGVINDVLDMAKIEADRLELSAVEFSLEQTLQKVMTIIRFRAEEKRQRLTVNVDGGIPRFLEGDDQRLTQVITNLLANAVKFTQEEGEIHLEALLEGEEDGICTLRFEVSDSGIGISSEQRDNLFEAFTQADGGINRRFGGTGLGLAISKRIVELMGGRIWVESELGKGAVFIFTIQARRCLNGRSDGGGAGGENPEPAARFSGKTLLLAEDIEINREILTALLEDTGIAIESAADGVEALSMVEAAPDKYDMVFMDVQMPRMDGLEATRRIRALPGHRREKLPIVALTANVFLDEIEACLAAGMDSHIGKPLDIDRVMETLKKYMPK